MDLRQTDLVRPMWDFDKFHQEEWIKKDITVLICERDTADILKLTVESLLRFYPDIPILIIDGGSIDDSLNYVRYLALVYPNVKVWERVGRNGHGTMLDDAIKEHVTTKYFLMLDSDVITRRGGWIEPMLERMNNEDIYAIGTLMLVTNKGDACGPPADDSDILRYVHPSCGIVRRETYLTLKPFTEHGAPLVYNMQDAQAKGLRVEYFPIEKYVAHLSGASWCVPRTIWRHDMDVRLRPFVSFIIEDPMVLPSLINQVDKDFEIVTIARTTVEEVVIHFVRNFSVSNSTYPLRFKVHGEYICRLKNFEVEQGYIEIIKKLIIQAGAPDRIDIGGLTFIKRKEWQLNECLL